MPAHGLGLRLTCACMQVNDHRESAVVLCRIVHASSRSLQERQTFCHELQRHMTRDVPFSGKPQHFCSDQMYPEYVIRVAE